MTSRQDRNSKEGEYLGDRTNDLTQAAQRRYDGERELTTEIVYAVAAARGVEPTDVHSPPLYECVDAATVETALFGRSTSEDRPVADGTVEFTYAEFLVTVRKDGWIQVSETGARQKTS
ncbi:HalOD1 output domain-containing protein [Halomicroarcula sp. GCM10025817]|uniref:HalOD1 output domain-containing protein n=1 Tax=Haloarcula TaxID=2237 RepID=UPI0023E7BA2D|nr:HalOD1 output domain-containing protein [Halomicroarcula sp. SYNS111]